MAHPPSSPPSAKTRMREVLAELRKEQGLPRRRIPSDWDEDADTEITFMRGKRGTELRARLSPQVKVVGIIMAVITGLGAIMGALRAAGVFH